jgi:hypothetical protein
MDCGGNLDHRFAGATPVDNQPTASDRPNKKANHYHRVANPGGRNLAHIRILRRCRTGSWALILMMIIFSAFALIVLRPKLIKQATLVPRVNAESLPRQVRQSVLDQAARSFRQVLSIQSWFGAAALHS